MEAPLVSENADEVAYPNLDLAQMMYEFENGAANLKDKILETMLADNMAATYTSLCKKYEWTFDSAVEAKMSKENEKAVEKLAAAEADAEENAGDIEVQDARLATARHYSKVGEWDAALKAYDALLGGKKLSSGKKIDATLEKIRIALWNNDTSALKSTITAAQALVEVGGDWDRRNRLKTYEALYLIISRDIRGAAKLLLDCVATFTAVELFSYERFMFYAVVTAIMSLSRTDMKSKIVKNPQVGGVIREVELMEPLVLSLYDCEYKTFFEMLVKVQPLILKDRYMGPHCSYILREYRIVGYAQFLEPYKSVLLSSMAKSFGVTTAMMDAELARFIASGRLNAKIDKVGDVVETVRPEKKSAQYHDVIKKGDTLLTSIQKLARSLDV